MGPACWELLMPSRRRNDKKKGKRGRQWLCVPMFRLMGHEEMPPSFPLMELATLQGRWKGEEKRESIGKESQRVAQYWLPADVLFFPLSHGAIRVFGLGHLHLMAVHMISPSCAHPKNLFMGWSLSNYFSAGVLPPCLKSSLTRLFSSWCPGVILKLAQ